MVDYVSHSRTTSNGKGKCYQDTGDRSILDVYDDFKSHFCYPTNTPAQITDFDRMLLIEDGGDPDTYSKMESDVR